MIGKRGVWFALLGVFSLLALLAVVLVRSAGGELLWWKHHTVTLHWNASTTPDVDGYHVYRRVLPDGQYSRIDEGLTVRELSFVDDHVKSGKKYGYVVRAVTRDGKESGNSEPVEADVR